MGSRMKEKIDELAALMQDFDLKEGKLSGDDWSVTFSKTLPSIGAPMMLSASADISASDEPVKKAPSPKTPKVNGTPITSPMMGIFYNSASPGSPPFVKVGDTVTANQVIGLIEAMKVFNEVTAGINGTVKKIAVESGKLVQVGEPLILVG
jgi:acetyl-CoA carboxylase biotin carboxyl carrier protein